jgi:hypothetical protein
MLALHLLQSALVLINTRLVDRVLADRAWVQTMTDEDRRGLTPLFWSNVALHGTFTLDMNSRLDYDRGAVTIPAPRTGQEPVIFIPEELDVEPAAGAQGGVRRS